MKQKLFLSLLLKGQLTFLFFLYALFVSGQDSLDKLTLIHNSSLSENARIVSEKGNLLSPSTHSSSFLAIAFPAENLKDETISLDYHDKQFIVQIGKRTFYPDLPAWQLIPIANFANSVYQSVFSVSGNVNEGKATYLFHRAFLDNLLGLRLFQASFLNMPEVLWEIPKDKKGNYILAKSEKDFIPVKKQNLYNTLCHELEKGRNIFTSQVLTDGNTEVIFSIDGDHLKFSDHPYYYFITTAVDSSEIKKSSKELETCYAELEEAAMAYLKEKYSSKLHPKTNLSGLLKALEENKGNETFDPYGAYYVKKSLDKLNNLKRSKPDEDLKEDIQVITDFTTSFNKRNWDLLKQYNPPVYSAVENTSHWTAFFRYIRLTNPNNWTLFLKKIKMIQSDAPEVKTPTSVTN
jgi:hypothetical protein